MSQLLRPVRTLASWWARSQVELHGEYSLERLRNFAAYEKSASLSRVALVCLLTPLPNLALITLIDCVPLAPLAAGTDANYVHWLRNLFTVILITYALMVQFEHTVPGLPISRPQMLALSVLPSVAGVGIEYALSKAIGFPLPFTMVMGTPLWSVVICVLFVYYFGGRLRTDAQFRIDLSNYMFVFICQVALTFIYPAYIYGFVSVGPRGQTYYVLLLPLLKILLKNWMSSFLGDLDDKKPEIVIFNIEIFNALYVTLCMQQSASITTTLVITGVDWIQAMISLRDLALVHDEVREFMDLIPASHAWHGKTFVDVAQAIVDEDNRVRSHPSVRMTCVNSGTLVLGSLLKSKAERARVQPPARAVSAQIVPVAASPCREGDAAAAAVGASAKAKVALSPSEDTLLSAAARVRFVKSASKLLFTSEFVVLIEYTEVIVPFIYTVYVVAVYHLSNRAYYAQIAHLTPDDLRQRILNVMIYSSMELLSFLLVSATLRRRLGVATFKQLTFVLERQWLVVQSKLLLWLFYAVQTSLDHIGADYSFQFAWLSKQPAA